jgi:glutamine---fructose-6-phosphate transaminase (isomerizing)
MCGIFGYFGSTRDATKTAMEGLKRLEYRGYDSWGVGVLHGGLLKVEKHIGKISDAKINLPGTAVAIGHTRWATHGEVSNKNAHPHMSTDGAFCLAHNGIVENFRPLKIRLQKSGYRFISDTDTEIIVKLIESKLKEQKTFNLVDAIRLSFQELTGRNTIIVLPQDGSIVAARNGSPLVVGRDEKTQDIYFSSDTLSFAAFANNMLIVDNGQLVNLKGGKLSLIDIQSGKLLPVRFENIKITSSRVDKEGYASFMEKEIHEEPFVLEQLIRQDPEQYFRLAKAIKQARTVYTIGSGSTGIAAAQIAFYLRVHAKILSVSLIGADSCDYYDLFEKGDLMIAPSQSGETADVLEVLEYAKKNGVTIASLVNMPGSMMTRMSDYPFMNEAGPEICVKTTKVFTSQIAWGYLVAKTVAGKRNEAIENLNKAANAIRQYLANSENCRNIRRLAFLLKNKRDIFLMGKYQDFNIMKEGMVKLIEGPYAHAHALPAGDLKHYVITLMEKGIPIIAALSNDVVRSDVINSLDQVRARGATVIGISSKKEDCFDEFIEVPDTGEISAMMHLLPLQLLSLSMAEILEVNVDKPRNIAKSVTVK